ncbi:MAG TPA: hypothetical protein VFG19_09085 [Geobacteraceae bacterium]|nr:hypothetical protein [Geobacteraceae bacterium]
MKPYLLLIFILNIVLGLCDASLGYHLAPLLGRRNAEDEEEAERTTSAMQKLLSVVVAVYVFLDCLAYFRGSLVFILVVTGIIVLDMIGQMVVRHKLRSAFHD